MGPPSTNVVGRAGELVEIREGDRQAIVTEEGGNLFRLRVAGVDLLDTVNEDGFTAGGSHGQVLMPWPGRIRKGVYVFEGERFQLPVNDFSTGSAIHGLTRFLTWQVGEHRSDRVTLSCRMLAMPGYPFPLALEQSYQLRDGRLEISATAQNIGGRPAPFGYGAHPYFTTGRPTIDDSLLHLPASSYCEVDDDLSPKAPPRPVNGTAFDFRRPAPVGATKLDVTLTELARDEEGRAAAFFRAPNGSVSIACRYDEPIRFLQVFSGDTLASHRRHGLALEPYTCAPDAFNNRLGLIRLEPGAAVAVRWSVGAE